MAARAADTNENTDEISSPNQEEPALTFDEDLDIYCLLSGMKPPLKNMKDGIDASNITLFCIKQETM